MQLLEWQTALQDAVLGTDDRVRATLRRASVAPDSQLAVYSNAYVNRLREALQSNFPALHQLLGDNDFEGLAARYIIEHPPRHASIRWFGDCLAEFLAARTPYSATPAIRELALFEWALRHAIDACDAERLAFEEVAAWAPDAWGIQRFVFHPSLTVLDLQWNVPPIWHALTRQSTPPGPTASPQACLIWRQRDFVTAWRTCDSVEAAALRALGDGASMAEICEDPLLCRPDDELMPLRIAGVLRGAVEGGYLCRYAGQSN